MIDLVYMSIVIQFSILRYVIISCVYISNEGKLSIDPAMIPVIVNFPR